MRVLLMLLSMTLITKGSAENPLDPQELSQQLTNLAIDGLGTDNLQAAFDKLQSTERPVDGKSIVPTLASSISQKFTEAFLIAQQLKAAVERSWGIPPSTKPTECCNVKYSGGIEFDSRFRSKVDFKNICVKISASTPFNPTHVADNVVNEMKDIFQKNPTIKWQYFASEQGIYTSFPAFDDDAGCRSYDHRFRPFYVETATPEPKDVVLVIDHSGSMRGERLRVAKEAAKTVLRTMNPRDRIGVVKFNNLASTPREYNGDGRGCYSEILSDATPINIKYLESYIDLITAQGGTHYTNAFTRAFDLLKGTPVERGSTRKRVILFLTDGQPQDDEKTILQTINIKNGELQNSVVILTYGMLQNLPILQDIARQRGLLTSITLPCYHRGKFIGVVGTDISMADLLSDVTYFQKGQSSYAWMADSTGRTIMHPLLPAPSNAYEDPIFMDITALETEPSFHDVLQSIKVGGSGQKSFKSKRYLAKGGQVSEGVTVLELQSTYFWTPVSRTNFTVGIVVADGEKERMLSSLSIPSDFKFLYHRLDLMRPDKPCFHFSRYASKDASVVKFGLEAFTEPYQYLGLEETISRVRAYSSFLTNLGSANPGFKPGVRDTVIASSSLDNIWFREKTAYSKYLVWRYFGSANGVFRITPGIIISKGYDPTKRPWYHAAVSNTGLVAISTPYIDAFGTGAVITASHTLYHGEASRQHTTKDQIIGVLGADFPLSYFQKLLTDTYPKCKELHYECFVLDGAGFLIMHKDFLSPDITKKDLEYVHISAKERDIANDLIGKGYLKRKQCRNLEKIHMENFYELDIPFRGVNTLATGSTCKQYQISRMTTTNAYIGIKKYSSFCKSQYCAACNTANRACIKGVSDFTCQCPCVSKLDFHFCRNEFPPSNISICPVPAPVVSSEKVKDPPLTGLQKCFDPKCKQKVNSDSCEGVVGCYWCVRDKYDAPLKNKYCADINSCYGGKEGTRAPGSGGIPLDTDSYDNGNKDGQRLSGGGIAGTVVGCTVPAILIVIIIVVRKKKTAARQRNCPVRQIVAVPWPRSISPSSVTMQPTNSTGVTMQPANFTDAPPSYLAAIGSPKASEHPFNPYYR
ncbi:VWFA and cache domain-containing protein 1 [Acropora cervicornis]|uniref:VWFA and cache domain-containing protein 1 n=1 Tax=Acropora cervicornis TaxID=6130 RepID=A0AAD9UXU9_ACRCE|nr:VWFA and cache domain-containing protein 1 [Acropora cervicornis]